MQSNIPDRVSLEPNEKNSRHDFFEKMRRGFHGEIIQTVMREAKPVKILCAIKAQ